MSIGTYLLWNLMTNSGFKDGMSLGGDWFTAWLYIGILCIFAFLGVVVLRNNYDLPFNIAGAMIGILSAIIIITLTGWSKIAFIVGLVVLIVGAFYGDNIFGGGG